jgi:hypothetical protein
MPEAEKEKRRPQPSVGVVLAGGEIVEMIRAQEGETRFLVWDGEASCEERFVDLPSGVRLLPYSPENNLLVHEVVLFPSDTEEYGSDAELASAVQTFIHRYVDLSPLYEEVTAWYVLFTWVYDSFNEVPYLRVRGDYGSGKSRFLLTVGSLCYRPIFASGASTVSPIFRILDAFKGTLIVDEGDFRVSDEKAEVVKILNSGNSRGFPVLRSERTPSKEFNPTAYSVFGPKLVATRGFFEDRALESRCITEELGGRSLRSDIPLNLPASFREEALRLRNKLLLYRFRNRGRERLLASVEDRTLEPRVSQIFAPLLATVSDVQARERVRAFAQGTNRELTVERSGTIEAQVVEVLAEFGGTRETVPVKEITERFSKRFGDELERPVSPRWIGSILRRRLYLAPYKSNGTFVLSLADREKTARLLEKYGVSGDGDVGMSQGDALADERPR